jgi:hypothetical protein
MFLSFTTELILGGNTATTQGRALVATVLSEVGTMWEKGDLGMDTVKSSVISLVCWEDLVKHPSHFTTTTHTPPFRPVGQASMGSKKRLCKETNSQNDCPFCSEDNVSVKTWCGLQSFRATTHT